MATDGRMHSRVPHQYKMNTNKRVIAAREGLASDEEEIEDIWTVEQLEEILCVTYERKMKGPRVGIEGNTHIHISVNVEPINPCATNTPRRTPLFRQPNFRGRKTTGSTFAQGTTTGGTSSTSISQVSTTREGSSSASRMAGHDPTIRLLEFKGLGKTLVYL